MDIQIKNQAPKNKRRIWLPVLITMLAIIAVWLLWFLPQARQEAGEKQNSFSAFREKIGASLRLFKKGGQETPPQSQAAEIDDLRARVFGDRVVK